MSRRSKYEYERNPWKMVLYILLVLLLIGCLIFLVYRTRQQKEEYQEQVQQMKSQETEYIRQKNLDETRTETEPLTESETRKSTPAASAKKQTEQTAASETESESDESETQSETTVTLDVSGYLAHVLLLNASGKEGVAGAWRKELEKDGYKNVTIASYTGSTKEQTQIYVQKSRRKLADHLQELFENADVNYDTFSEDFEMPDGARKPEDVDVYVLIGREDIPEE